MGDAAIGSTTFSRREFLASGLALGVPATIAVVAGRRRHLVTLAAGPTSRVPVATSPLGSIQQRRRSTRPELDNGNPAERMRPYGG